MAFGAKMNKKQCIAGNTLINLEKLGGLIPANKETEEWILCFLLLCAFCAEPLDIVMEKYRQAAVLAVEILKEGSITNPEQAWNQAVTKIFPTSTSLKNKGCPKGAFLGLCNEGMVSGIPAGSYSKLTKNGEYAITAVKILRTNPFLVSQPALLWKNVAGNTKSENSQMDVVIGLWEANYIST